MKLLANISDDYFRQGQFGGQFGNSTKRWQSYNKRNPGKDAARLRDADKSALAILDFETDPFDPENRTPVYPFLAVLYAAEFQPIILWDNDWRALVHKVRDAIFALPGRYHVYAHNGGKFDYMFMLSVLRGIAQWKGNSLMRVKIGRHELRDSLHIIPERLKTTMGKDDIEYWKMKKDKRDHHRQEIIDYCISDCRNLYDGVKNFRERFGSPMTIGQLSLRMLRKEYPDVQNLSDDTDSFMRTWYHGGRVQCFHDGVVSGAFDLYDVNSMYPFVMAKRQHPISSEFYISDRIRPGKTAFVTVRCKNNGALVSLASDGSLTTECRDGIFDTTFHEYDKALSLGLITDCEVIRTVEFSAFTDFSRFVEPIYARRQANKENLDVAYKMGNSGLAKQLTYDVLFDKLLLNTSYGKFAQNPRRFKDYYIGDGNEPAPPGEWSVYPEVEGDDYTIYSKPISEFRFNNVATAASITGAARAHLMAAIHTSEDVLYCDTDSIICRRFSDSLPIDPYELGAWDREASIETFIGNGKKLYAYQRSDKEPPNNQVIKSKGVGGVTWQEMIDYANGNAIEKTLLAPTLGKDGSQVYITRRLQRSKVKSVA